MVADGEEGHAGRAGLDEADERLRVVYRGGVEEASDGLCNGPHGQDHQRPWDPA